MPAKLIARSFERYRAGAAHKRIHGGNTITRFYVWVQGDETNSVMVEGYGPTPGERKTHAIARARKLLIEQGKISD